MKKTNKKSPLLWLIIAYFVIGYAVFYVTMPSLNWHDPGFWTYITLMMVLLCIPVVLHDTIPEQFTFQNLISNITKPYKKIAVGIVVFCFVFPIVMGFISTRIFHANEYANRIQIENVGFDTISEVDFSKTPIIDRNTTESLGDRVMGQMTELVSQFTVSEEYTQISYKNSVYRVTPLEYADFIKWFMNSKDGIPAYITVDSTNGKAKLVTLDSLGLENMKYVPSAKFGKKLYRHLRFRYPFEIFGSPSFELDEAGHPWYVCTTYTYKGVGNKKSVTGAIFVDPISGDSTRYNVEEIPAWSDRIFPESMVIEEIDDYGSLQKGFINSIFGQKGVIQSSSGYNYLEKDGDIWLYTGITSVTKDSSNLGFILVNLRTHEAQRISAPGADETSAMKSAQDEVKNYGYEATFPVLVNVNGQPTYLMSLRSSSDEEYTTGVIKMYAMVDATDYQKVATVTVEDGLNTLKKLMIGVQGSTMSGSTLEATELKVTVHDLEKIFVDGNTKYYFKDEKGNAYKLDFATKYEDQLAFLKEGDTLTILYIESEGIQTITGLK